MQRAKGIGKLESCEEGNQYLGGFPWVVSHSTYVLQSSTSECFWQAFLKWSWWSCTAFLLILLILWINWSCESWQHLFWINHSQMHHPKLLTLLQSIINEEFKQIILRASCCRRKTRKLWPLFSDNVLQERGNTFKIQ